MRRDTKIYRRRRQPGEFPSLRAAIRNHCLECVCWDFGEVKRCTAPECWLFPYRLGTGGEEKPSAICEAEKAAVVSSPSRQGQTSPTKRGKTQGSEK